MKCDLCKGNVGGSSVLCDSCTEAIRRLVRINRTPPIEEEKGRARAQGTGAP
jgi:hypothetical protein